MRGAGGPSVISLLAESRGGQPLVADPPGTQYVRRLARRHAGDVPA